MAHFHSLTVKDITKETADTVSVAFDITDDVKSDFNYEAGQYVTLKMDINGEEIRRSYSLCSSPLADSDFRIAIKKVKDGRMSGYINDSLKEGDVVEVMPPAGNFKTDLSGSKHIVAFAAGSGITPVFSILKTALANNNNKFTLFYGNRTTASTIFKAQLDELSVEYGDRLNVLHMLDEESTGNALTEGRIDKAKAVELLKTVSSDLDKEYFICGPEQMIMAISDLLKEQGIDKSNINFELFTAPTKAAESSTPAPVGDFSGTAKVTLIMDDEETVIDLATDGLNVLDAAMNAGVDAPFSCKGAVCCTCKCKVTKGSATMEMNYALSDDEVEEGFILACQAHPSSEEITIDFDVI